LAGFFGKFYLFSAALHADANQALLWLVVLGLVGSLVSLYYYLLVLKTIFVDGQELTKRARADFLPRAMVSVLAAAVVLLGVMPNILASRIVAAVQ
jgi:NADH-quinone oxidoreductase subunit N